MTGIQDLSKMLGAANEKVNTVSVQTPASNGAGQVNGRDQALTGIDQSVVSTAAGALMQAAGTSDVRTDKVAELKAAIASGSYQVSASDVADKLIQSLLSGR